MSNALAIDAIVTMMWSHRSFGSIVYHELKVAIEASDKRDDYIFKFNNNLLSENEAVYILESYQLKLIEKYKVNKK